MKTAYTLLIKSIAVIIAAALFSCETDRLIFNGPYFVRFTDATLIKKESYSQPVKIEVHHGGPAPKHDVIVNYTISGNAREGIDYTINGTRGQVKIKSGEYVGYIQIKLIDNANNILRSQDIVFTLETISDNTIEVGQGKSAIGKSFTFTIQDDCIVSGSYYGLQTPTSVPVDGITISSADCQEYTLSNWDIDIFNFSQIRDLTFIDNADNTLTIPEQEEETLNKDQATIKGSGVVNPITRVITMTVILVDFDKQPQFTFTLVPN